MEVRARLGDGDRRLTQRIAASGPPGTRRLLSAVEDAAQNSKLWWGTAALMAWKGGARGRAAAGAGLAAVAVAQVVSNAIGKQLTDRERPPEEWIPHDGVEDRPDSSSFPSGHTAAAVAFVAAVLPTWPAAGALCAVPAVAVAVERVHSGAHYPTDVAAGAVVGLAGAWLVRRSPRLVTRMLQHCARLPARTPA